MVKWLNDVNISALNNWGKWCDYYETQGRQENGLVWWRRELSITLLVYVSSLMWTQVVQKAIWRWISELGRTARENALVWVSLEADAKKDLCASSLWDGIEKHCEGWVGKWDQEEKERSIKSEFLSKLALWAIEVQTYWGPLGGEGAVSSTCLRFLPSEGRE